MRDVDNYTAKYMEKSFEEFQVKYRRKMVLEQVRYYNPNRILEVGCGNEPLFYDLPNISFTVVEPSKKFYERAKYLSEKKNNVLCIQGELENVTDRLDNKFDMVICSALLHEVERPFQLLNAITSVCNPGGGIVHVNVPNANSMHRLLAVESGLISNVFEMSERNKRLQQHSVFDMEGLVKLVESSGMKVVKKGSYFVKPFSHEQMYNILKREIVEEAVLDGLYKMEKYMPGLGSEIYVNCQVNC